MNRYLQSILEKLFRLSKKPVQEIADEHKTIDIDVNLFATIQVTDFSNMFLNCVSLSSFNLRPISEKRKSAIEKILKIEKGSI
jgi:hypothetical protein